MKSALAVCSFLLLAEFFSASAQSVADSLRKNYEFAAAIEWCKNATAEIDSTGSPALQKELALSENGLNMSTFCSEPVVVAKSTFSLADFFLYYPLEAGCWRPSPEYLDPEQDIFGSFIYAPDGRSEFYFSLIGSDGDREIFRTSLKDTLWTIPDIAGRELKSPEDEIFPWLSPDGNSLYFSSKGFYGMGGYDLFVSRRDETTGEWGPPSNLGFPFSSPYDDYLFVNSPDGSYSVFASNRECPPDSVVVYILEYDALPLRQAYDSPEALKELCSLPVPEDASVVESMTQDNFRDDLKTIKYKELMEMARELRDSLAANRAFVDSLKRIVVSDEIIDRETLAELIAAKEELTPKIQDSLDGIRKEIYKIEAAFLSGGIEDPSDPAPATPASKETAYKFEMNAAGEPMMLVFEIPDTLPEPETGTPPDNS